MPRASAQRKRKYDRPGQPAFVPTAEQRSYVSVMVAGGIQQDQIAAVVDIDMKTLRKHFRKELDYGMVKANTQVVANLFRQTRENVRAAEFWLVNRDSTRWRHAMQVDANLNVRDERPDFSRLSREELAILREAAALMRRATAPMIEAAVTEVADEDEGDDDNG